MNFPSITHQLTNKPARDPLLPFDTPLIDTTSDAFDLDQEIANILLPEIAPIESSSLSSSPSSSSSSASLDPPYQLQHLPQDHHPSYYPRLQLEQHIYMGDSPSSPRDVFPNIFSTSTSNSEGQDRPQQYQYENSYNSHSIINTNTQNQQNQQNQQNRLQNQNSITNYNYSNMISDSSSINSFNRTSSNQDVSFTPLEQSSLSRSLSKSRKISSNSSFSTDSVPLMGKKSKRRKHKNSKLGCSTCKERRVKCSEDLPSCTNCIKHKVKCPYLDYSEEQLNELRQAQFLQQQPSDSEDELQPQQPQPLLPQKKISKPKVKRNKLNTSQNKQPLDSISTSSSSSYSSSTNLATDLRLHTVTQNFDNLLSQRTEENLSIVYPVYSYDQKEASATSFSQINNSENSALKNAFVGALNIPTTFKFKTRKQVDYSIELNRAVKVIGPLIQKGTLGLPEIRGLYSAWLNSFIYKAYTSELMFNCLLNLATNFLISNIFRDTNKYMENSEQLTPNSRGLSLAHVRLECTQHSLRYYALVIKDLRNVLNDNSDPDLCGSVSYILSLMSIYDPEATLNSSICFRDGLFSIFNHNIQAMKKALAASDTANPNSLILLPAHNKLMTNIAMSVYFPGYDPSFLGEYQQLLVRFGDLIFSLLQHYKETSTDTPRPNYDFLQLHYQELLNFTNDLNFYIPQITNNLSDMDKQKELLFQMLFTWVRMFPSKLIISNKSDPPLIKVLHLFFKLMKKSLFAIFPQVKYFFLRDFDSPLMLDVFATDVNGVFEELDDPEMREGQNITNHNNRLPPELYVPLINELKSMSSYLIRGINFFQMRLNKLYRLLVSHSNALQFDDNNVKDVNECREKFKQLLGLKEVHITSFIHQTIHYENYPRVDGEEGERRETEEANDHVDDNNVDFMTLQPNGLLINDFDLRNIM